MTTPTFDVSMITLAIASGVCDEHLRLIEHSLNARVKVLKLEMASQLTPGRRFYLNDRIKPKLLSGVLVEFVKWVDSDNLQIKLLANHGQRWRKDSLITITTNLIGELK